MEEQNNQHPKVLTVRQIVAEGAARQRSLDEQAVRDGRMSPQRYQELQRMREWDLYNADMTLEGGNLDY